MRRGATKRGPELPVTVRPLREDDLDAAHRVMHEAFEAFLAAQQPGRTLGDVDYVRPRFRAAPASAWAAELDGELVGSNFATRWGSFGFIGPLSVRPDLWDRGIGSLLLRPVVETFERWRLRQSGLFTFPHSTKHIGLYQKHGFWPRYLNPVLEKPVGRSARGCLRFSALPAADRRAALEAMRELTGSLLDGLDLAHEAHAVHDQALGDTLLVEDTAGLAAMAVCHCGPGSEAGSDACWVKFAAARPGDGAPRRFAELLAACERFAADAGAARIVAGVNAGRIGAYRSLLQRGFRLAFMGLAMRSRPEGPDLDRPGHFVVDDLR
jgi:GNAT superfamily N-acetyltransferase